MGTGNNNYIWIYGGDYNYGMINDLWQHDLVTGAWTRLAAGDR